MNFTHSPHAERRDDLVGTEAHPRRKSHESAIESYSPRLLQRGLS
jgi:hypothetical protein